MEGQSNRPPQGKRMDDLGGCIAATLVLETGRRTFCQPLVFFSIFQALWGLFFVLAHVVGFSRVVESRVPLF